MFKGKKIQKHRRQQGAYIFFALIKKKVNKSV